MRIKEYISKQFSSPKGLGGSLISVVMNHQNRPLYDATMHLLQLSDSDSVLDIGCGNGFVLNLLARRYDACFTGIDTSESAIKAASRRNLKYIERGNMNLSCQDVSLMSFSDESFSKAYTINTVYFWNDLNKTMAEIWRVLKVGGIFVNTLYTNETLSRFSHTGIGYKKYTSDQLTRAGENAGLSVKSVPIVDGAAYSVIYTK